MTSWAKMVGTIPFLGFHLTKILRAGYSALIHIDALHTIENYDSRVKDIMGNFTVSTIQSLELTDK